LEVFSLAAAAQPAARCCFGNIVFGQFRRSRRSCMPPPLLPARRQLFAAAAIARAARRKAVFASRVAELLILPLWPLPYAAA
jgi:hypothetical protein